MLIGKNIGLGFDAYIKEPNVNREASNYVLSNYNELICNIRKLEIKEEKAQDLLHDVYISIVEAEDNGDGFDMEFGTRYDENSNLMDVAQFVNGRIKLYAKNSKYRTDIIEATNGFVNETQVYFTSELDRNGQEILNKDGTVKLKKVVEHKKVQIIVTSNASSFNSTGEDDNENNDKFQKAFAKADVADSTEDIAEAISLREEIDFCIDICETRNINILNVLKNIDALASMLGDYSKKKKVAESVFSKISELAEYHEEFGATLMGILKYSASNRESFETVLASY